jgi:hypothetical protein
MIAHVMENQECLQLIPKILLVEHFWKKSKKIDRFFEQGLYGISLSKRAYKIRISLILFVKLMEMLLMGILTFNDILDFTAKDDNEIENDTKQVYKFWQRIPH